MVVFIAAFEKQFPHIINLILARVNREKKPLNNVVLSLMSRIKN